MPQTTKRLLDENFEMNSKLLAVQQDMIDLGVENKQLDLEKLNQLDRIKQCRIEEAKYTRKNIANHKVLPNTDCIAFWDTLLHCMLCII